MPVGKTFGESQREAYLALLRAGVGVHRAARQLGWNPNTVRAARKSDPDFDQSVRDTLAEAAEPIEVVLYEAALRGEPWAVQMWLKGRLRETWADKVEVGLEVSGTVEIEAGARLAGIVALQAALEERRAALSEGAIEARSVVREDRAALSVASADRVGR